MPSSTTSCPGTTSTSTTFRPATVSPGSIGHAIAAIHTLPTNFVGEAGLPVLSAAECHTSTTSLIESAASTGLLPSALRDRWRDAAADSSLWQFQPTVINGALTADSFLVEDESRSPRSSAGPRSASATRRATCTGCSP